MRRLAAGLVVFVLAFATVACGSSARNGGDFAAVLSRAAAKSAEARTARFEMTGTSGGEDATIEGVIDFEHARSSIKMTIDGEEPYEVIMSADTYYVSMPESWRRWVDSRWVAFPVDEENDFGDIGLLFTDPLALFDLLRNKAQSVEDLGRDNVRGDEARHYRLHVETAAFLRTFEEDSLSEDLPDTVAIDAWVDGAGLVRRISWDLEDVDTTAGALRVEYWDYGTAPEVDLPPDDQVTDIDALQALSDKFAPDANETDTASAAAERAFAGAACYGERTKDCFAPNPELDAIARDPALCQQPEARVCLVPVGTVRKDVVDAILAFHRETKGIDVVVLPSLAVDPAWVDARTSQADTTSIYEALKSTYGVRPDTPSTYIAVTPIDLRPRDGQYPWWFGARFGGGGDGYNHGVFSYFRMANVEPYDGSPLTNELLFRRATRYFARYVALLYLDYPMGDDIGYLNYREMGGFSVLDQMGAKWPEGPLPCMSPGPLVCLVPDADYMDGALGDDLKQVAKDLGAELGLRIDVRPGAGYYPSQPSWSEEFANDLRGSVAKLFRPGVTVIGVTDDELAQDPSVAPHIDRAFPSEGLAIVSGFGAGKPGTAQHRARLRAVLLRAIAQAHYGLPLNDDPTSLLYSGITRLAQTDGKAAPAVR